jgi:peptidoglycan/LPS O-acetylase OafA/YrhL
MTRRFEALDGYRAIAALVVLVYHVLGRSSLSADHPAVAEWTERLGNYGVTIFFVLSGFLLYRPYALAYLRNEDPPDLRSYTVRRIARIVPGYWFALTALFTVFRYDSLKSAGDAVTYYGFGQIYRRGGYAIGGLGQAWSLCVEVAFYLAVPALAFALGRACRDLDETTPRDRLRFQLIGLTALFAFGAAYRWWAMHQVLRWPTAEIWLPGWLPVFALGMGLAVASAWSEAGGRMPASVLRLARSPLVCFVLALESYWVLVQLHLPWAWAPETMGQSMGRVIVSAVSAAFLLLPGILGDGGAARGTRWLCSRPLVLLGTVSYGVYLWHTQWIRLYLDWRATGAVPNSTLAMLAFVLVLTLVSATVSWYLVERPCIELAARFRRIERSATGPATAVAPSRA